MRWTKWIALLVAGLVLPLACDAYEHPESPAPLAQARQSIVTPISFVLPKGATARNTALAAIGESLHVNDGAQIVSSSPAIPGVRVLPVIASNGLAQVGVGAWGGAVVSRGNVWLRGGRAGSVTTGGVVELQAGSDPGSLEEHAILDPGENVVFTLDLPTGSQGPRQTISGGPIMILAPGAYDRVTASSQSQLRIQSGTYSLDALILEAGSVLRIDNSAGPVLVHIRSEFIYRGTVTETVPDLPNVLFAYMGNASVPVERAFRGTLVAPNASVMVSGPATTHTGAIFGRRVELHQRHFFVHRPLQLGPAPICDVATFIPVPDYPFDRSRDIDNDHQGVTHDDDTWYFTNAHAGPCFDCLPPLPGPFCPRECVRSAIWSFGVDQDVNASNPPVLRGNPWEGRYNHFGDITFVPGAGGPDLIFVALEASVGGIAERGAIGLITSDLQFHNGFGVLPVPSPEAADQDRSMPWVSVNRRGDGLAYSSAFNSTWLNSYRVTPREIRPDGTGADIEWIRSVRFRDCRTEAPVFISRMQGSAFSDTRKLYISLDVQGGGVIVVDPTDGRILDFADVQFDREGEDEELEGVTIWDREDRVSPGIRGHVHVQMVQNDANSNDNFYFKHLLADDFGKL